MAASGEHLCRAGWRAVFDPATWVRAVLVAATGVVSMAVLACGIALVRDTAGHDWYAAGKLTLTELLIEAGFDEGAPTEYRTAAGVILTLTRDDLRFNGEALLARDWLLATAAGAAELGALCGLGGALLCLALVRRPERDRPWPARGVRAECRAAVRGAAAGSRGFPGGRGSWCCRLRAPRRLAHWRTART